MKTVWMIPLIGLVVFTPVIHADSFGFYFRNGGFGMGMEFGNYDYYDRYSPGFYDYSEIDFRAALSPYGNWEYMDDFDSYVWIPYVDYSWRPYSNGTWVYSSYGWTWVAYEPWGWIPHHYGRWFMHPYVGWIWIPGYTWAPAHVRWGYTNGYYAWAPMPPDHCRFYVNYTFNYYDQRDYNYYNHYNRRDRRHSDRYYDRSAHWYGRSNEFDRSSERWIPNEAWNVVRENDFLAEDYGAVSIPAERASAIIQSGDFRAAPRAPEVSKIESTTGRRVERIKVDEVTKRLPTGEKIKVVQPVGVLETRKSNVEKVNRKFRELGKENEVMQPKRDIQKRERNLKRDSQPNQSLNRPDSRDPQPLNPRSDREPIQKPQQHRNRPSDRDRRDVRPESSRPQSIENRNDREPVRSNPVEPQERPNVRPKGQPQGQPAPQSQDDKNVKGKPQPVKKNGKEKPATVDEQKKDKDEDNRNAKPLQLN